MSVIAIEFGLESMDESKPDYIVTIRLMDVLLGTIAAFVVWAIAAG